MSDSVRPHRRQPNRLPRPWYSPGKNSGVGCHFLLQCMKVKSESEVAQSCPTLSDPTDCSLPGSSIHGIFQARVLEWGAIAFSVKPLYPHTNLALCISSLWPLSSCMCDKFFRLYPTLCDAMDYSPPWDSPGKNLGWVAMPTSRGSCRPRNQTMLLLCLMHWFSSVQSLSHVQLCDPMDCSTLGLAVHHQLTVFTQTYVH